MRRIAFLLPFLVALGGCADNVGDVNRTQPNKVKKSLFSGEWYYRATIIDVPPTAGFTFVGEQTENEKITWDIQEQFLLAYRSYEHIADQEKFAQRPGVPWVGAPVAAYRILSHFDVQREYNPATGEQSNVVSENTTDRHWHKRDYIRVDWSQNLVADFTFVTSTVRQNPIAYFVPEHDAGNPDRIQISESYLDVVNKMFVQPEVDGFLSSYFGSPVPACWLMESLEKDCVGQAIKVRHSFLKVSDRSLAYEPLAYDDKLFNKFGFFRNDRFAHDKARDLLEGKTQHWINRFNLWLTSRECVDAAGSPLPAASCRPASSVPSGNSQPVAGGKPPDENRIAGTLRTIPIRDRKVRPIVYHLNDQYPPELLPAAKQIADAWDDVFRDTVANAYRLDGRPTKKEDVPRMFILCTQNPVVDGKAAGGLAIDQYEREALPFKEYSDDRAFCGREGELVKIGDLRHSMLYWVPAPTDAGLLGYGPMAADPETGEIIAGNAFVYGAAHETFATFGADVVQLLNGKTSVDDFKDGKYLIDYLKRTKESPGVYKSSAMKEAARSKARADWVKAKIKQGRGTPDYVSANEKRLGQSRLSQLVLSDEMVTAMTGGRVKSARELSPAERERFSPTAWRERGFLAREKKRIELLSRNNITALDFRDDAVLWRANHYKTGNKTFEQIRTDLLSELMLATTLHEMGHTVGLRHNFAGSSDPLNYFTDDKNPDRDYWQLRKQESLVATPGGKAANNPSKKRSMVPRYYLSDKQAENDYLATARKTLSEKGLHELQYSSIMDYGMKFNSDIHGLGKYDAAAIRFGYGGLVEAWDFEVPDHTAERLVPVERHYTVYPELLNPKAQSLDEQVASITRRKVVRASDIKDPDQEVPYRFCSDEYAGARPECHRFDNGADMWEAVRNNTDEYRNYYWFYNFKRGRVKFGLEFGSYLGRIYGRHFEFLSSQFKHMTNEEFFLRSNERCGPGRFEEDFPHYAGTDCGADLYLSSIESLNFFGEVLARPDVGKYGYNAKAQAYELGFDSTGGDAKKKKDELVVGLGDGRYGNTYYSHERYGYDFYYKPVIIGSWWDKWLAVDALGNPETEFIQDQATESLQYVFNFRVIFPNPVNNMVGALITESLPTYAPSLTMDGKIVYPTVEPWNETYAPLPQGAKAINPSEQYFVRLLAAFDSLMYFTDNYDQDFTYALKIFLKGSGEAQSAASAATVEVTDPVSNRTYVAIKYQPLQQKLDARGRPMKDSNGKFIYEPVPDFLPVAYDYLTRVKARSPNDPGTLHDDLAFADIIRDAVHLYEYRQ